MPNITFSIAVGDQSIQEISLFKRLVHSTVGNCFNEGRQKVLKDIFLAEKSIYLIKHFNAIKITYLFVL